MGGVGFCYYSLSFAYHIQRGTVKDAPTTMAVEMTTKLLSSHADWLNFVMWALLQFAPGQSRIIHNHWFTVGNRLQLWMQYSGWKSPLDWSVARILTMASISIHLLWVLVYSNNPGLWHHCQMVTRNICTFLRQKTRTSSWSSPSIKLQWRGNFVSWIQWHINEHRKIHWKSTSKVKSNKYKAQTLGIDLSKDDIMSMMIEFMLKKNLRHTEISNYCTIIMQ